MKDTKPDWRRALLAARAAIPDGERRIGSTAIADRVRALDWFTDARTVLGYVPLGAEVDCSALLGEARDRSAAVFVPAIGTPPDQPRWSPWVETSDAVAPGLPLDDLRSPILVLVPGVGFDYAGTRLGRGGGFYDRALADLRRTGEICAVGLAFEQQIVPVLPSDAWDQPVDAVASERRLLAVDGRAGDRAWARSS